MTEFVSNKITIKNFVVIKEAEIDIKDINVIIGPQANGKSLIAKLIYFFSTLSGVFIESARKDFNRADLDSDVIKAFSNLFPSYIWSNQQFNIAYTCGNVFISIKHERTSKKKGYVFSLDYSEDLLSFIQGIGKRYQAWRIKRSNLKALNDVLKNSEKIDDDMFLSITMDLYSNKDVLWLPINKEFVEFNDRFFGASTFIPAGRSFFSILQKNIFSMLSQGINIDPLMAEFGSLYENTKEFFKSEIPKISDEHLDESFQKVFHSVVKGSYLFEDDKEWIVSPSGLRTNIVDTSSGQQEAIPMLLVLSTYPHIMSKMNKSCMIFMEEPEAHLFPTAQADVVSLLSSIHEESSTKFFITTHSPYVLASLNNMIQAGEMVKKGKLSKNEFKDINKGGSSIDYNSVSAYTIVDGVATSIMDEEYRIIGGYSLDEVSSHFQDVMNKILEKDA